MNGNGTGGSDIRARLNHSVVDGDGHLIEATFALLDFIKQVGGADIAERFDAYTRQPQPGGGPEHAPGGDVGAQYD